MGYQGCSLLHKQRTALTSYCKAAEQDYEKQLKSHAHKSWFGGKATRCLLSGQALGEITHVQCVYHRNLLWKVSNLCDLVGDSFCPIKSCLLKSGRFLWKEILGLGCSDVLLSGQHIVCMVPLEAWPHAMDTWHSYTLFDRLHSARITDTMLLYSALIMDNYLWDHLHFLFTGFAINPAASAITSRPCIVIQIVHLWTLPA